MNLLTCATSRSLSSGVNRKIRGISSSTDGSTMGARLTSATISHPAARINLESVVQVGFDVPSSIRATTDCEVLAFFARSRWESLAALRARLSMVEASGGFIDE